MQTELGEKEGVLVKHRASRRASGPSCPSCGDDVVIGVEANERLYLTLLSSRELGISWYAWHRCDRVVKSEAGASARGGRAGFAAQAVQLRSTARRGVNDGAHAAP